MRNLSRLASQLYNTPLLIQPDKAQVIEQVFQSALQGVDLTRVQDIDRPEPEAFAYASAQYADKPYVVTEGNVAVIPVMGTLMHRAGSLDAMSGMTGYSRLDRLYRMAQSDRDVKGILLEMDSPGGSGAGLFDLADFIKQSEKPIWAAVNESAYSAGYALAASAQRIAVTRTAGVGSVGVIALHMDQSERDKKDGRKYTAIYAGERKNDFNSHYPLSNEARATLQASIDRMYDIFVQHVAMSRSLTPEAVKATEAGLFEGAQAVEVGFADSVQSFNETLAELEAYVKPSLSSSTGLIAQQRGVSHMANTEKPTAEAQTATFTQADIDQAKSAAHAEGYEAGLNAERERITGIYTHAEAEGRKALADQCVSMGLSVDQAAQLLASAQVEQVQAQAIVDPLAAAMSQVANPQVGALSAEDENSDEAEIARIAAIAVGIK